MLPRLKSHANHKDFWTDAIVFCSKDDYLTKTQIKFLEADLYDLAKEAHRAKLDNSQVPTRPNISEVDKAEVVQFLEGIKLILSSLGINILEPRSIQNLTQTADAIIYELKNKNAVGKMSINDDKYVVLKGSTAVLKNRPSIPSFLVKLRKDLVDAGIMIETANGLYTFMQDAPFTSPSYAASAIVGGAANGRDQWKYGNKSLKQMENESLD